MTDDDVVDEVDTYNFSGAYEVSGDADIGFTGTVFPAGMVVDEDDAGGIGLDGGSENLPWMDEERIECSLADFLATDESVSGIEEERKKVFFSQKPGFLSEKVSDLFGLIHERGFPLHFPGQSRCQGEGTFKAYGFVAPHTRCPHQFLHGSTCQLLQRLEPSDQIFPGVDGGESFGTGSEENGNEFAVTE